MSYRIFDLETTTEVHLKRRASPFTDKNWVVAAAYKEQGCRVEHDYFIRDDYQYTGVKPKGNSKPYQIRIPESTTLLVGFNIKFDLLWSWRHTNLVDFFQRGGKVWCCQYAEYLLEGHLPSSHMVAMDDIIEGYGGELKIDEVKALWKAGVNTPDIDKDLLLKYLTEGDIPNTEKIFLGQVKRARELGILQGIMARMDGLCATAEMEYNGLHVDREQAFADKAMIEGELDALKQTLESALPDMPKELTFNWGSPVHKSCLLYGGAIKYQKWTPYLDDKGNQLYAQKDEVRPVLEDGKPVRYKSGKNAGEIKTKRFKVNDLSKPKGAQKDYVFRLPRLVAPKDEWLGSLTDGEGGPVYSVSGEIIQLLSANYPEIEFLNAISLRDRLQKDLGTYYEIEDKNGEKKGMLTCLSEDDIIHHKLNHVQTVTSRLSSSDPNLQNVPRSEFNKEMGRAKSVVKRSFTSRFPDGMMIESDYSQLEVVVQGLLTGDQNMIQDIKDGVDFHVKRLAAKLGEPYDEVWEKCHNEDHPDYKVYKQMRTKAKGFTFARAFGAGKASIAANTGMTEDEVQTLIDAEEVMYPGVSKFFDSIEAELTRTRVPTLHREPLPDQPGRSVQCGAGYYIGPTQVRFGFLETPAPAYKRKHNGGKETTWYRPSIQNYPVQGEAAHIVQIAVGKVWRDLFVATDNYYGNALLVNTVHDCVVADSAEGYTEPVAKDIVRVMQDVPAMLKELFGTETPVGFPCEAEVGFNLLDMKGINNG